MANELDDLLKREMSYVTKAPCCRDCVNVQEPEMGEHRCTLNGACHFRVDKEGYCRHFKLNMRKQK